MIVEDVELRFVERRVQEVIGHHGEFKSLVWVERRIPQMRKLVRQYLPGGYLIGQPPPTGPAYWTDWQDVPLVKE
jgi:hypothetical protein